MNGGIPMKRTRKRIICILAAAAVSVCSLPQSTPLLLRSAITANAAETSGTCGENLTWTLDSEGTLTISGTGAMTEWEFFQDKLSFNIPWYEQRDDIKKVVIEEGVTTIGKDSFNGCNAMESVSLPVSLTQIGESAFLYCTSLADVTIPDGVTVIESSTFDGCNALSEIIIPDSVTAINTEAFRMCTGLKSIRLPEKLSEISLNCFGGCTELTEITIPQSVTRIGQNAFRNCRSLNTVTIPENVKKIEREAFIYCSGLTDVTVLNDNCAIYDDKDTFGSASVIHGYAGSTAEEFAEKYGRRFEEIDLQAPIASDWAEKSVISKNTEEAELVVRVGDIDACNDENAVADHGYDPFTAKSQYAHGYPWQKDETDPAGTDRIFVGSKWNGNATDGYASNYAEYKNGNDEENAFGEGALSFTLEYDASEIDIENVILQLCIDDFQALSWDSVFTVSLNGKDAPFIAELLNHTDQTGPTAYIVSAVIPSGFFEDIASGKLTVVIDETTGVGDGYAIDFARLLINYDEQIFTGTFSGKTEPGATVRLLGTSTTVTAASDGSFTFNAIPGINAVRASKTGFVEKYDSGIVLSAGTEWKPELSLAEGTGSPDIDFSKFAETGKPVKGDYNADGEITVADAVLLARFLAEDTELYAEQIAEILNHEPDFDDDGLLTIMDLKSLLNHLQPAQKAEVFINEINVPDAVINDDRFEADGKWYDISSTAYDGLPLSGDVLLTASIPGEVNPEDLGSYVFVYYDEKNDECRYLYPDSYDLTAGTMTIDLPHFSFWGSAKLTKEEQVEAFLNSYSTKLAVESGNSKKSASELEPYVRAKAEAMGLTKQATEDLIQSSLNFLGGRFTGKNKAFIETGTKYTTTLTRGYYDKNDEAAMSGLEDAITDALMNSWDELQFSDRLDEVLGSEFAGSTAGKLLSSSNGIARMAGYLTEGDMEDAMKELGSVMQGVHPAVELSTKAIAYLGAKVNEEFTNWKSNQIEELYQIYKNGASDIWGNEVIPCNRDSFLTYLNTSSGFTMAKGVGRFYNLDKVGEICKQYNWPYSTYEELPPRFLEVFQQRAEDGLMQYFELRLQQEKTAEEVKKTERACIETMMSRFGALDSGSYGKFFGEATPDDFDLTARLERLVNVRSFVSQYVDEVELAKVAKDENSYNYGDILNWWVDFASNNDKPAAIRKFREKLREYGFLKTYEAEPIETPALQIQFDYVEGWAVSNETKSKYPDDDPTDVKFGGFYWTQRDDKEIVRMTSKPVFEMFEDGSFRLQIAKHSGKDDIYNSDDEKIGEFTWSNNGFTLYGNVRENIDGLDEWEAEINDCSVPFFEFEEANQFGNHQKWYFKDSFRSGTLRYEKYEGNPELYVDIITADGEIHIECTWRSTFHW